MAQRLCGSGKIKRYLQVYVDAIGERGDLLDVGGGTGLYRDLWPAGWNYTCLDNDPVKLQGFLRRNPQDATILGDAAALPLPDAALDAVICTNVSHHLSDKKLDSFIRESARVLRPGGTLIFLDAVWRPSRIVTRMLWKLDRGSSPRTRERLLAAVSLYFDLSHVEKVAKPLLHEYVLCIGTPRKA